MSYTKIKDLFKDICDAIREKTGGTDLINHTDIPSSIRSIETGSETILSIDGNMAHVENTTLVFNTIEDGNEVSY